MELKEYIEIFQKQQKIFWVVVLAIIAGVVVWQQGQPVRYQATLLLNIGRDRVQDTAEYTYDGFYRLQADERFADTVVRWLGSPRVVSDIYVASGLDPQGLGTRDLKNLFGAKRLSSQVVEITYADADTKALPVISETMVIVLNRYAESLNKNASEPGWFVVIGGDPVIRDARIPFPLAFALGLALALFIGFWTALLRHYFRNEK